MPPGKRAWLGHSCKSYDGWWPDQELGAGQSGWLSVDYGDVGMYELFIIYLNDEEHNKAVDYIINSQSSGTSDGLKLPADPEYAHRITVTLRF